MFFFSDVGVAARVDIFPLLTAIAWAIHFDVCAALAPLSRAPPLKSMSPHIIQFPFTFQIRIDKAEQWSRRGIKNKKKRRRILDF